MACRRPEHFQPAAPLREGEIYRFALPHAQVLYQAEQPGRINGLSVNSSWIEQTLTPALRRELNLPNDAKPQCALSTDACAVGAESGSGVCSAGHNVTPHCAKMRLPTPVSVGRCCEDVGPGPPIPAGRSVRHRRRTARWRAQPSGGDGESPGNMQTAKDRPPVKRPLKARILELSIVIVVVVVVVGGLGLYQERIVAFLSQQGWAPGAAVGTVRIERVERLALSQAQDRRRREVHLLLVRCRRGCRIP